MNRVGSRARKAEPSSHSPFQVGHAIVETSPGSRALHTLFAPLHYEPNYAYPLLVWLHGRGENEGQLPRIMPLISMRNYVGLGPRGIYQVADDAQRFEWGGSEEDIPLAEQVVFDCIEVAREKSNIAPHRIFLAGFQCGGTMAFRIALRNPERFAGVLSVGGPFPADRAPLARLRQARGLPLFIAQGRQSPKYPTDRTCEELRLFHCAGLSITLRQYPCGDELTTQMLHDMDVWMMEQVTGIPSSTDHPLPNSFGESN